MNTKFVAAALLATKILGQEEDPPSYSNFKGPEFFYASTVPSEDLDEEVTGGKLSGKFWFDGITNVSIINDEAYFWILATVHAP